MLHVPVESRSSFFSEHQQCHGENIYKSTKNVVLDIRYKYFDITFSLLPLMNNFDLGKNNK